jgi:hypothetical protein
MWGFPSYRWKEAEAFCLWHRKAFLRPLSRLFGLKDEQVAENDAAHGSAARHEVQAVEITPPHPSLSKNAAWSSAFFTSLLAARRLSCDGKAGFAPSGA